VKEIIMAATGATPRKFAEKIAMHNQKGAEEEAEFRKIMAECASVKTPGPDPRAPGGHSMPTPMQQVRTPIMTNPTSQMMLPPSGEIHLSPNFPNHLNAVPRHGSLPNVGHSVLMSTNQIQESDIPSIVGPMSNEPGNVFMDPSAQGGHPMNQMTSGGPGSNPMTILNPSSTNHQNHLNHHGSLRDQIVVGSSGGSATQIHTIRSSQSNSGTGPIRTKHRKDTSPYGSERLSISNAPGGSSSHLSPPDTSGAWRRVRSDPFLATHARSNSGSSTGVSPAGSVTDAPTAVQDSNGGISPLHGASPTMQRRGTVPYNSGSQIHHAASNVQNVKNNYQLGIPIPETSSGGELKPGSLPNLTNLEIGQAPGGGGGNTVNHSCNSSNTSTAGGPGTIAKDGQESPYSSSMSATSGGSSSFVRLSDNEISKILSIPMSLVSENCSQREQSAQVQSEQAKNPNVNVSSAGSLCDNTQRNLLHLNKGIAVEQHPQSTPSIIYGNSQLGAIRIKTEDGQNHHPGDLSSLSNYRNPRAIHPPASPVMPGSPIGRSSTPIDCAGSPHSPSGNGGGVGGPPQSYPDAMAMAGPNYQHFMELTNDVQKLSVLETPPSTDPGMYIPTASGYNQQQPINEFVDFFNNQQQIDMKNNMNQFSNTNPQTPSSIPDIILTDFTDTEKKTILFQNF